MYVETEADWKYNLDISSAWGAAMCGELTHYQLAQKIAQKIREQNWGKDESGAAVIASSFEKLPSDCTFNDTVKVLEQLDHWGDDYHFCWIRIL